MNSMHRLRDALAILGLLAIAQGAFSYFVTPEWPPVPAARFPFVAYVYERREGPIQHEDFEQLAVEVQAIEAKLGARTPGDERVLPPVVLKGRD